jgi:hypothetical protein
MDRPFSTATKAWSDHETGRAKRRHAGSALGCDAGSRRTVARQPGREFIEATLHPFDLDHDVLTGALDMAGEIAVCANR